MPSIGHLTSDVVSTVVTRITSVPDPPLVPGRSNRQVWSDQRLHRLVRRSPWDAAPALRRVLHDADGWIRAPASARSWPRRSPHAGLELAPATGADGSIRIRGALHIHRMGRATPVELTLVPWSVHQTDLCLQPHRGRFGAHLPRRYYDTAHLVMDELWHLVERAADAFPEETT